MKAGFLVILGGLPGAGKTTLARELARRTGATHLRIDSIEQALRDSGGLRDDVGDAGYRVAYAVAADNLRLHRRVVADSVNPIAVTRQAWRDVAADAGVEHLEVEVVCSDAAEHRRRIETRAADLPGLRLPAWADVVARAYEPRDSTGVVTVDTARHSAAELAEVLAGAVAARGGGAAKARVVDSSSPPVEPTFEARVRASFAKQAIMATIGARLSRVAPGEVTVELPFRDDLTQQHGFLHAGIVTTVVDSACGYAALTRMPPDEAVLTAEYKVNLLSPAVGDSFVARASVIKSGATLTVARGDVLAVTGGEEKIVATMLATLVAVRERGIRD
jgi:uncharacterized protein (TIGR00369 family)